MVVNMATRLPRTSQDPLKVVKARARLGMSIKQLAKLVNVTPGRISEIESGVRSASPAVLTRIAAALGCEASSLR